MAGMTRGGAGQTVVIAQPQTEILPGLDRPTAVLWLGLSLWAATNTIDNGPLRTFWEAAQGHYDSKTAGQLGGDLLSASGRGLGDASLELLLVAFFWVIAKVSDSAGSLAILLLVGLWLVWLLTHVQNVATFLGHSLPAPAQIAPVKPATK
jgi:hypothetical protein